MPGIPAADLSDGPNFLEFLRVLKSLLPGKSVSVAAPSAYYDLKGFPIGDIGNVVDYIVYMTYDIHGQVSIVSRSRNPQYFISNEY
jgi:GH18 family chitinase